MSGTISPSISPTSFNPTFLSSVAPTNPSSSPSSLPSDPSCIPTSSPTYLPTFLFTYQPSAPTYLPSLSAADDIVYYGGDIMFGEVTLYNIFYGDFSSSIGSRTVDLINYLATHIGNSSWYNIMTAYYDQQGNYISKNVSFGGNTSVSPSQRGGYLNDSTLVNTITDSILSGAFPLSDKAIYAFIFRGDITYHSALIGNEWLKGWCGYHFSL